MLTMIALRETCHWRSRAWIDLPRVVLYHQDMGTASMYAKATALFAAAVIIANVVDGESDHSAVARPSETIITARETKMQPMRITIATNPTRGRS